MVKRRNSRYKAFAWGAPRRVPIDCTPAPAAPMQPAPRSRRRRQRAWSPENVGGTFFI
jgi:hypothetical protein